MSRLPVLAVLAGLIVLAFGIVLLSSGGPGPTPITTPSPSPEASAAAAATPTPEPVPGTVRGGWVAASRGTPIEELPVTTILIGEEGVNEMPADFFLDRRGCCTPILASSITVGGPDILRFTMDRAFGRCENRATGDYRWSVTPDGQWLTLELVTDECSTRSDVLAGTWQHSLAESSGGGPGIAAVFEPYLAFTLPASDWIGWGLGGIDEVVIDRQDGSSTFKVWKDLDGFNDPCDIDKGRLDLPPGIDGFLGYLNGDPRFTVDSQEEFLIDGHRAVEVAFTIGKDIQAPCWDLDGDPANKTGVLQWATHASPDGFWNAEIDSPGLVVVTEVGDATLVFEAASGSGDSWSTDRATLESVRFLDAPPTPPAS